MPKRPASSDSLEEPQESKKPKLGRPAGLESLVPNAVSELSQPSDVVEAEEHSLDERSLIISQISKHWLRGTIAEYLPEHAYPANGGGNILQWPFALLEALLALSLVTAGQEKDLRSRLTGAFVSAKRYSLARSLKNIRAVHDSFAKKDSTESSKSAPPGVESKDGVEGTKTEKTKTKRKAGDGFTPWKPEAVDIPATVQPHWGIVPRPGGYRPSEIQPPAKDTNAAVHPALWEDRKGAVRVKRGSRYINGYDQAIHMWLPLMDMRPISRKNQAPKRQPVIYYYNHGMPTDWNDVGAINDLNKALQEAIKAKSNKEPSFTAAERTALAKLFAEDKKASIWDIAEQFNDQVHPITEAEKEQYPKGRFTESIRHEYLMYKSTYDKGEAPTDATKKDIELEKHYAEGKKALDKTRKRPKKAFKAPPSLKMSDTADVTKKRTPKQTAQKPSSKKSLTQSNGDLQEPVKSTVPMSEQPRLSGNDECLLEAAGAYTVEDVRPPSPLSAVSREAVDSLSYGSIIAAAEQGKQDTFVNTPTGLHEWSKVGSTEVSNTAFSASVGIDQNEKNSDINQQQDDIMETQLESRVEAQSTETQTATRTDIGFQEIQIEDAAVLRENAVVSQYANVNGIVGGSFVEKAVRDTQVDENYSDDDQPGDLF
ncbi:uncharacterized protein EKO05_0006102 [Ascochyta rabiei]|uniref:uncharacterized protein n=1 Tax=Didymella rabiei TaxID=5454 RepID=UPI001900A1E5|nr:uncharacterized protein EKO05_0006102 [Ascochyta rabiei]UPX15661.1 hypothetical protein EKO05_0006102 [Ascochyta rabiei]